MILLETTEDELIMKSEHGKHIDDALLELFILDEKEFSDEKRKEIETHLQQCEECQHKMAKLRMFYDILEEELQNPISENAYKILEKVVLKK